MSINVNNNHLNYHITKSSGIIKLGENVDINKLKKIINIGNKLTIAYVVVLIIATISLVVAAIYYSDSSHTDFPFFLLGFIVIIVFLVGSINWTDKYFNKKYKELLLPEAIKRIMPDAQYKENYKTIAKEIEGKIIKRGTNYSIGDYVCGTRNGIKIEINELNIYKKKYSSEDVYQINYFNGVWFVFDFNKKFENRILIYNKNYPYIKKFGKKIDTENITFNKYVDVYTDSANDEQIFYVLTPKLIEKIIAAVVAFKCVVILYFNESKLYLGIDKKFNLFEPVYEENIDPEKYYQKVSEELRIIFEIIDSFNQ